MFERDEPVICLVELDYVGGWRRFEYYVQEPAVSITLDGERPAGGEVYSSTKYRDSGGRTYICMENGEPGDHTVTAWFIYSEAAEWEPSVLKASMEISIR